MPIVERPALRALPWVSIPRSVAVQAPKTPLEVGWLDGLISAVTVVRDTTDLAVFPYVKIAASLVLQVLEVIKSVKKNIDDFEELAQSLVQIVVAIRDTLLSYCRDFCPPPAFATHCQAFIDALVGMFVRLSDLSRHSQSWTRYLKASATHDTIVQYRKQLEELRANFTLTTLLHLSLKIFTEQRPRQLGYTWEHSEPLQFIDAMNVTLRLPMELCSTPRDFADLLKFLFRKRRGRRYVERGHYALTTTDKGLPHWVDYNVWRTYVLPGSTLAMNILLRTGVDGSNEAFDSTQCCPACGQVRVGGDASWDDEVTCPSCGAIFCISRKDEGTPVASTFTSDLHVHPWQLGGTLSPEDDLEETDVKYFRRFHVLVEKTAHHSPSLLLPMDLWAGHPANEFDADFLECANFENDYAPWLDRYSDKFPDYAF
ncbi:hypothetical protein DXG01_000822 [Tephrocybe rancida]|nr:hypothetical protein DXG01_000822 [Tephrocybe rancida]